MANVLSALTQAAISIQSPERVSLRGEGYQIRTVGESESLSMSVWARHSGGWMDMAFKGLDYSKAGLRVLLIGLCLLDRWHLFSLALWGLPCLGL